MLKGRLYEHARALGIVGPESLVGEAAAPLPALAQEQPVDLNSYRMQKGMRR